MKDTDLKKFKEQLEKERDLIQGQLEQFAKKDETTEGDWDTKFPSFADGAGGQRMEEASDEVEAYSNLLAVEHALETRLKHITAALEKIAKKKYGMCEQCGKSISHKRLQASPSAAVCTTCAAD